MEGSWFGSGDQASPLDYQIHDTLIDMLKAMASTSHNKAKSPDPQKLRSIVALTSAGQKEFP